MPLSEVSNDERLVLKTIFDAFVESDDWTTYYKAVPTIAKELMAVPAPGVRQWERERLDSRVWIRSKRRKATDMIPAWVLDVQVWPANERLDCLSSPLAQRVVGELSATEGLTVRQIAERTGLRYATVGKWLKVAAEAGVAVRMNYGSKTNPARFLLATAENTDT